MIQRLSILTRLCLVIYFFSTYTICDAQVKSVVKKSYAYFETRSRNFPKGGNEDIIPIQTDSINTLEKSNKFVSPAEKDTSIVIYIETTSQNIIWDTAWQNKQYFLITAFLQRSIPFHAGFLKAGKQVVISPAKGIYLFELQLLKPVKGISTRVKISKDAIIIKGKYKGRAITWKTAQLKEIIPVPAS